LSQPWQLLSSLCCSVSFAGATGSLGDLGNVIEAHRFGGRRSEFFTSGKLALSNLGLFQQHRSKREAAFFGLMSASTSYGHAAA
jgi:hypothetical protein